MIICNWKQDKICLWLKCLNLLWVINLKSKFQNVKMLKSNYGFYFWFSLSGVSLLAFWYLHVLHWWQSLHWSASRYIISHFYSNKLNIFLSNLSLFLDMLSNAISFLLKIYKLFPFLSVGDQTTRRPELLWVSPATNVHTAFIECDICHVMVKSVWDLRIHKKEHHFSIIKPKAHPGPVPNVIKTPSPVSWGNVQKTPNPSPVLLLGWIACPLCKTGCNDRGILMGHISAEHPGYKFLCDKVNCNKVYISKSGLFKHKKTGL